MKGAFLIFLMVAFVSANPLTRPAPVPVVDSPLVQIIVNVKGDNSESKTETIFVPAPEEIIHPMPIAPVQPSLPIAPVQPISPIMPIAPVQPISPIMPIAPVQPISPIMPIHPISPIFPEERPMVEDMTMVDGGQAVVYPAVEDLIY